MLPLGCSSPSETDSVRGKAQNLEAWAPSTSYTTGDQVEYQGRLYTIVQPHTSLPGWEPPNVPALWRDDGPVVEEAPDGTPVLDPVFPVSCDADPLSCCPSGAKPTVLTEGNDVATVTDGMPCVVALDGNDTLSVHSSEPATILAGHGDDTVMGGPGADLLVGGRGRDTLYGYDGANALYGGAGDDVIFAGNGDNHVYPGPGVDTVATGTGDDIIYILDLCEVEAGEQIDAGTGRDTLISPVPLEQLQAMGVSIVGIENVLVRNNSCRSECSAKPECGEGEKCVAGDGVGEMECKTDDSTTCEADLLGKVSCIDGQGSPTNYVSSRLVLPQRVDLRDVVVAARQDVHVLGGAKIEQAEGVIASAEGAIEVGPGAIVPGTVAPGEILLGAGASIEGDVLSDSPVTLGDGATISGSTDEDAGLSPPVVYSYQTAFTSPTDGDVLVVDGRSRILLPGSYGSIEVESGGTIYLRSGEYSAQELTIGDDASVVVMPDAGWVTVFVSDAMQVDGTVKGIGLESPTLALIYGGSSSASVGGMFKGAVLAPGASLNISEGPHEGLFYGANVFVAENTELTGGSFPWEKLVGKVEEPDSVVLPDPDLPGSLEATSSVPGRVTRASGFEFVIPRRIPVGVGNSGNGWLTISMTREDGSTFTCSYSGGASVASPSTLMQMALGREYTLDSCSDGTLPFTTLRLTDIFVELTGDPAHPAGKVGVNLPLDKGCDGILPQPMSLAESRQLIEDFEWPFFSPPFYFDGLVPETVNGKPSIFYAQIYITSREELEFLDRLLIHWEKDQIFSEEWPEDWKNVCGNLHYDHDGEGIWVWAMISGATYNALLQARGEASIDPADRELFKAVRILDPPDDLATSEGSVDLDVLADTGFQYRGLTGVPDAIALQEALFEGGGATAAFANALKWVFDKGKQALQGFAQVLGLLDKIFGNVDMTMDVNVLNGDPTFPRGSSLQRAWGPDSGAQIAPQGAKVLLWTTSVRLPPASAIPFRRLSTDRMSQSGFVSMNVAKGFDDLRGAVEFNRICIELENDAGYITTFLMASSVCNRSFDQSDHKNFERDFRLDWGLDNRNARHLTEVTDSYRYLLEVVSERAKQAVVLVGPNATVLSGFNDDNAAALCLGYGDFTADAVNLIVGSALGYVVPIAGAAATTYLSILSNTDILVTDNSYSKDTRGLMTHEYGHYALCDLVRKNGENLTEDVILTLDSLAAGAGNPDPDEEARIVNEAFADFFSLQIAGGANYSWLSHLDGREPGVFGNDSVSRTISFGFTFSTDVPGGDSNIFGSSSDLFGASADVEDFGVGRLAGFAHDLFDGRPHGSDGPGSSDAWVRLGNDHRNPVIEHRNNLGSCSVGAAAPECRHGDVDLEGIALGGARIKQAVKNFMDARNLLGAYRVEAMEVGMVQTALESTGNWCQTCLAAATHFFGFPQNPADPNGNPFARDLIDACQVGAPLAEMIGPPPRATSGLNAFTCEACPVGQGMGRDGTCTDCPVDETVHWGGMACRSQTVTFSTDANDFCPETFIVEVSGTDSGTPATALNIYVADVPTDRFTCAASSLSGEVLAGSHVTGPLSEVTTFATRGEFRECEEDDGDDICLGESEGCHYPHPLEDDEAGSSRGADLTLPLGGVPGFLRIVADAGANGVNLVVEHDDPSCLDIVK